MAESSFFDNQPEDKPGGDIPHLDESPKAAEPDGTFATDDGRLAAFISYIPFACFIPLLNMRQNEEAQYHARQGVVLFLIELVAAVFLIDAVSNFVFAAILIIALALAMAGMLFALQGRNYRLPIISDLAEKLKM